MSKYLRKFPRKNNEFNTYLSAAVPHLNSNSSRLNVSSDNLDELNELYSDPVKGWIVIYPKTTDESFASSFDRKSRTSLRTNIESVLSDIFADIPKSVLVFKDRKVFRMMEKSKARKRAPKKEKPPIFGVREIKHLMHRLYFKNPETPDSNAMPYKNHVVLEFYIGQAGLSAKNIPFSNSTEITRFLKTLAFAEGDVGKTIYYRCCYVNSRGDKSTWSAVKSEVIA
jgi:hypothetical protein